MTNNGKFKILTILVLVNSLSANADIVGGEDVKPKDPIQSSVVGLYGPSSSGKGGSLCTASLIGDDTALTAAHCLGSQNQRPVLIFGRDLHSADTVKREVTNFRINPLYGSKNPSKMDQGDIAVIQFKGGIPTGYKTTPVLDSDSELKRGSNVTLSGYGISNAQTHQGAGLLRRTEVKVASPRKGKSEMILDQSQGHGACHGDSGGPAFVRSHGKRVLAGVTNRSYPDSAPDDCAHKVVYTKVSAYRPWIDQTQKEFHQNHLKMTKNGYFKHQKRHLKDHKISRHAHVKSADDGSLARSRSSKLSRVAHWRRTGHLKHSRTRGRVPSANVRSKKSV